MSKTTKNNGEITEKILTYAISDLVADRFARYARYVLIDRAIPNVCDGLKPVQRRILHAMNELKLTNDKVHKKSARVVGEVIGKFHPHGDSSVYNAIVRMAQPWKNGMPLIDMQGNKGSIDGDTAAAMRYTEIKLTAIAQLLLKDIKKDVVRFNPNFDETETEPLVLPSYFPNLLVNGATGIAVGLATNIPPHNLNEVLASVVYRIKNPNSTLTDVMKAGIKGPDFPTGGTIQGLTGIKNAYRHGKGRIIIRAKTALETTGKKSNGQRLVITELPYEVVKQDLVKKIEEARLAKNAVFGMKEVRDETDRTGLRIVVELTHDANYEQVLNYLLKYTNLQISYNLNLVAIADKKPKTLSLLQIIDYYIQHQVEVVTRRSKFELKQDQQRLEIIDGLIIALKAIDEVIQLIRQSENRQTAKQQLISRFNLTDNQAEAIILLRLYRLSATDVKELNAEKATLTANIKTLNYILKNQTALNQTLITSFEMIAKIHQKPRMSELSGEITEIVVDEKAAIKESNLFVTISYDGWIKAINSKILADEPDYNEFGRKPNDLIVAQGVINNLNHLLIITNRGNYILLPGYKLIENKWKEIGTHLNTFCKLDNSEKIIAVATYQPKSVLNQYVLLLTKYGMIKRVSIATMLINRLARTIKCIGLHPEDEVVFASFTDGNSWIILTTMTGQTMKYLESNISILGLTAKGIKALKLATDDYVIGGASGASEDVYGVVTTDGLIKRLTFSSIETTSRTTKGHKILKSRKQMAGKIAACFLANHERNFNILTNSEKWKLFTINNTLPVTRINEGFGKAIVENVKSATNIQLWNLN